MSSLIDKEILIIDDMADVRLLARKILEGDGAIVSEAESVDAGLAAASRKAPHLILTDLDMPVKTGFDFLRERQAIAALKDVPALVLSGMNDKDSVVRAIALGARDYVLKPFRATLLLQKVRKALMLGAFKSRKLQPGQAAQVSVSVAAEISKVGESGCHIECPVRLAPEERIKLSGELIERLGLEGAVYRITREGGLYVSPSNYRAEVNFVGISDGIVQRLRSKIGEWK